MPHNDERNYEIDGMVFTPIGTFQHTCLVKGCLTDASHMVTKPSDSYPAEDEEQYYELATFRCLDHLDFEDAA